MIDVDMADRLLRTKFEDLYDSTLKTMQVQGLEIGWSIL